jgi:hypothetical protein
LNEQLDEQHIIREQVSNKIVEEVLKIVSGYCPVLEALGGP